MKNSELLDIIGSIDDAFIDEADAVAQKANAAGKKVGLYAQTQAQKQHTHTRRRMVAGSIAACLCLVAVGVTVSHILPIGQSQFAETTSLSATEGTTETAVEGTDTTTATIPQGVYELSNILAMIPENIPTYLKDRGFEETFGRYTPTTKSPSDDEVNGDILNWWTDESDDAYYFGDPARMYLSVHPLDSGVMDSGIDAGEFYGSVADFTSADPPRTASLRIIVLSTDKTEDELRNEVVDALALLDPFYETSTENGPRYYACTIGGADGVFTIRSYAHSDGTYEITLSCYYLNDYCESHGIAVSYEAMAEQLTADNPT